MRIVSSFVVCFCCLGLLSSTTEGATFRTDPGKVCLVDDGYDKICFSTRGWDGLLCDGGNCDRMIFHASNHHSTPYLTGSVDENAIMNGLSAIDWTNDGINKPSHPYEVVNITTDFSGRGDGDKTHRWDVGSDDEDRWGINYREYICSDSFPIVVGIEAGGSKTDSINIGCGQIDRSQWELGPIQEPRGLFSEDNMICSLVEENTENCRNRCPTGTLLVGIGCQGDDCDNVQLRCRSFIPIVPTKPTPNPACPPIGFNHFMKNELKLTRIRKVDRDRFSVKGTIQDCYDHCKNDGNCLGISFQKQSTNKDFVCKKFNTKELISTNQKIQRKVEYGKKSQTVYSRVFRDQHGQFLDFNGDGCPNEFTTPTPSHTTSGNPRAACDTLKGKKGKKTCNRREDCQWKNKKCRTKKLAQKGRGK